MGWLVFDRKRCHISKRQCYISPIEPPLQARFANRGRIEDGAARRHPMAPARAARYNGKSTTMAKPLNISPDRLFPAEAKTRDIPRAPYAGVKALTRKSGVWGKHVSVRVDLGVRRTHKKKKHKPPN